MATDPYVKLQINLAASIAFTIIALATTQVKNIIGDQNQNAPMVYLMIALGFGWMVLAAWNIKRYKDMAKSKR